MIKFTLTNRATPGDEPIAVVARNLEEACDKLNWQRSNALLVDKDIATEKEQEIADQNAGLVGSKKQ